MQVLSGKKMRIKFSSGVSDVAEKNSSFASGILRVAYTGKNRNNSFISKETFERCIGSIYNCPIVCNYDRETDTIGAHDMELVTDENGGMRIVNVTEPVGVIPESAEYYFEEIEDNSGIHEYLCVDALIWKRQEAYKKIKDNEFTDQSMEISVKDGDMRDGVYVINDFEFTAFCLLGSAEPCFESASLEVFSCDGFKDQLAAMMQDLKETYSVTTAIADDNTHPQNYSEGGEELLNEEVTKLLAEFNVTQEEQDALDFNLNDFTVEELREKFTAMRTAEDNPEDNTETFALEGEFRKELYHALGKEEIDMPWGKDSRYWPWDYDKELSEVYATDSTDWNIYGFTYSMDGDKVLIDFASKKRMKLALVPFDEGEQVNPLGMMFEKFTEKVNAINEQWKEEFALGSDTIATLENEVSELRKFKADTENAIAQNEREEVFAQFEDLAGIEAFENLREHCADYTTDVLEEKCYAIRGRNGAPAKFSLETKTPKLVVEKTITQPEPYGGIFAEYGVVPRT